jgi:hypothetical protein
MEAETKQHLLHTKLQPGLISLRNRRNGLKFRMNFLLIL